MAPPRLPLLAGMTRDDLTRFAAECGQPRFRAAQLGDWIFGKHIATPDQMTNLPAAFRQALQEHFLAPASHVAAADRSEDGTEKLLLRLYDGESVEMVLIPSEERMTFCLSTQVGCPVRCRFCASGADGLRRNLLCGEIIEEFTSGIARAGQVPDNLVFMGIGEGLLNFEELSKALLLLTAPEGYGLSPRRITVSTSGIVPGIAKLAALGKEFTLAISLHAVNDELRSRLIPDFCRYPVAEILRAVDDYRETTGRMPTFEYTLLDGVNDSLTDAAELGRLSRRHHAKINLIPYNPTGSEFRRPSRERIRDFARAVERSGGKVTVRKERGSEGTAACGQLRRQKNSSSSGDSCASSGESAGQ